MCMFKNNKKWSEILNKLKISKWFHQTVKHHNDINENVTRSILCMSTSFCVYKSAKEVWMKYIWIFRLGLTQLIIWRSNMQRFYQFFYDIPGTCISPQSIYCILSCKRKSTWLLGNSVYLLEQNSGKIGIKIS
jgi:hypothetical protein